MGDQAPSGEPPSDTARAKRRGVLNHLGHPWWQGIGAVVGAVGVLFGIITFVTSNDDGSVGRGPSQPTALPTQPTASADSEPTFLDGLDQVEGYLVLGGRKVNGRVYAHALSREIGSSDMCGDIDAATGGFDLDRRFSRFSVVAGLSDDASSGTTARFKVYGDGQLLKSASATLGKPAAINVPVAGILRLRLVANTNICQYGDYGEIVWADPTVTP